MVNRQYLLLGIYIKNECLKINTIKQKTERYKKTSSIKPPLPLITKKRERNQQIQLNLIPRKEERTK